MAKVIKCLLFVFILAGFMGMFLSCEDKMTVNRATDLMVEMRKSDDMRDVLYLGIDLPSSGHEEDVAFVIHNVVYQSNSVITVQNSKLVFEDVSYDDFQSITLKLPSNDHDVAVLDMMTVGGEKLLYYATGTDFNVLLEYLSQN